MIRLLVLTGWILVVVGASFLAYWRMSLPISPREFHDARAGYCRVEPWLESGWLVGAVPLVAFALVLVLSRL